MMGFLGSLFGGIGFDTILSGFGVGMQAKSAYDNAKAQNAAAEWNAAIADQNASNLDALAANQRLIAQKQANDLRRNVQGIIGDQRAITGASGVKVDVGSSADVQASTRAMGEYDAQTAIYNAEMGARKYEMDARNSRTQAQMSLAARRNPWMAAATPIISGVSDLMWKHTQINGGWGNQQAGAQSGGKSSWWKCPPKK